MSQPKVTIADIAKRADVSKTTVSRVLNNKPDVDAATRSLILGIIQETGFVPQKAATHLAKGKAHLIGLMVPSLTSGYSLTVIQAVAEAIEETEYELLLYTTSLAEKNQERFMQRLRRNFADGLVVLLPRNFDDYVDALPRRHFPVILIDHRGMDSGYPSITADNRSGAIQATEYLLGLGHRRIGFITGLMDFGSARDRLDGYREALARAGLPFDSALVAAGDFSYQSGFACARDLLSRTPQPTALFCSNDQMAFGAMAAADALGIRIPSQLSIIGFDDVASAATAQPPLTTVRQPLYEMGVLAVEALLRQIEGDEAEEDSTSDLKPATDQRSDRSTVDSAESAISPSATNLASAAASGSTVAPHSTTDPRSASAPLSTVDSRESSADLRSAASGSATGHAGHPDLSLRGDIVLPTTLVLRDSCAPPTEEKTGGSMPGASGTAGQA